MRNAFLVIDQDTLPNQTGKLVIPQQIDNTLRTGSGGGSSVSTIWTLYNKSGWLRAGLNFLGEYVIQSSNVNNTVIINMTEYVYPNNFVIPNSTGSANNTTYVRIRSQNIILNDTKELDSQLSLTNGLYTGSLTSARLIIKVTNLGAYDNCKFEGTNWILSQNCTINETTDMLNYNLTLTNSSVLRIYAPLLNVGRLVKCKNCIIIKRFGVLVTKKFGR
jgi:hypothetical protein